LTNALWLLPAFPGFGYIVDIVDSIISGKKARGLPKFGGFVKSFFNGFIAFRSIMIGLIYALIVIAIPFILLQVIIAFLLPSLASQTGKLIQSILIIIWALYFPLMMINILVKKKTTASLEFKYLLSMIVNNFGIYIGTLLKTALYLSITLLLPLTLISFRVDVFGVITSIFVWIYFLIGIPMSMSSLIYLADFYREFGGNK
jgi:hypothetical protein